MNGTQLLDWKVDILRGYESYWKRTQGTDRICPSKLMWQDRKEIMEDVAPTFWPEKFVELAFTVMDSYPGGSEAYLTKYKPTYNAQWFVFEKSPSGINVQLADGRWPIKALLQTPVFGRDIPKRAIALYIFVEQLSYPVLAFTLLEGETLAEGINLSIAKKDIDERSAAEIMVAWTTMIVLTAFLEQKVVVQHVAQTERHARRRAEKENIVPEVKVVRLRKEVLRESAEGYEPTDSEIEWSCQWVVRGHWRDQYHPSTQTHEPKWITPYLKGPEDKPLKVRPEVRMVVR